MTETTFFRLLATDDKATALADAVVALHDGHKLDGVTFPADPQSFRQVPGAPFAYWVSDSVRAVFSKFPAVEAEGRLARCTSPVGDNFRFARLWWEPAKLDPARNNRWYPWAKGGSFSPYYYDIDTGIAWDQDRRTYPGFLGTPSRPLERPASADLFFRPGITWPLRTNGLSFRVLPERSIFGAKGGMLCVPGDDEFSLFILLAIMNSEAFKSLVAMQLARTELAQSYEVGLIQQTPVPRAGPVVEAGLVTLARRAWSLKRALDTDNETSHVFTLPGLLQLEGETLVDRNAARAERARGIEAELATIQAEVDDLCFTLYGVEQTDRHTIGDSYRNAEDTVVGSGVADPDRNAGNESVDAEGTAAELVSWAAGAAHGRFDVRLATGVRAVPPERGPFDALPACSPGMLVGDDGLPARETPPDYPLRISRDGILVDDAEHPEDVVRRVREVLTVLWPSDDGSTAEAIEQEACDILEMRDLREYFRKPGNFFADHLRKYSKSRRQAPIYWPLSTASGSYTLWVYYHRLTSDTLYTAVNRYVEPKIAAVERDLRETETRLAEASGREAARLREQGESARSLLTELRDFRDELLRVAALPYRPNLDDGVIVNAAPLNKLFRLPKWAKDTKACWEKLERGDYDWAHLAHTIWPERVREKCRADRSLAIAHGLEEVYKGQVAPVRKRSRRRVPAEMDED